jgi:hypothetical protein
VSAYHDGSTQRSALAGTSRRTWRLQKRLTVALLEQLRAFVDAHPTDAFYFYNPKESLFSYDLTGVNPLGRYLVRFSGRWAETVGMGRTDISLELIETA